MAVDVTQSAILARLQQRSAGAYDRVKDVEGKPGGRSLPGGLMGAIGQLTDAKVDESEKTGDPFVYLYARTVEPEEHRGLACGNIFMLNESDYSTFDENMAQLVSNLKLLGYEEMLEGCTEPQFFGSVLPTILASIKEDKPCFVFNTARKARKDGTFRVNIQGLPPDGYVPPAMEAENEHENKGYKAVTPASRKSPVAAAAAEPPSTKTTKPTKAAPASKGKAPGKAPPKQKALPTVIFGVGTRVQPIPEYFNDGDEYPGEVVAEDGDSISVKFDADGSVMVVPADQLVAIDAE